MSESRKELEHDQMLDRYESGLYCIVAAWIVVIVGCLLWMGMP